MVATIISITENNMKILAGTVEEKREADINTLGCIEIFK